ncbi:MAG TPA: hypothetical protein VF916_00080 [Ktedonobacterales bacterium]
MFVPVDRVLSVTATLFGIGAFLFALRTASNPMGLHGSQPGWALPVGIVCLIAGLTTASLVTWRESTALGRPQPSTLSGADRHARAESG